ncbi:MAG: right-handed parallel beta-helix repeat-containing protein [Lentisphaeria bacterium]|nr:right-handed parallel beta-helix repeat-containing protein [Lentisphaeria bacterium]
MKKTASSLLAGALLLTASVTVCGAADAAKIAQVKSGKLTEAKASWWGFDKKDSTKALQSALDSGAKKIIVENMGSDWIVSSIKVPSDVEIVFEDGVVVRAKKGEFKNPHDSLFDISNKKNVKLLGKGKVLFVMNRKDYDNKELYKHGEWRHTVNIWNSDGVHVENFSMCESGGDGVYVGSKDCRNVVLKDLNCYNHYRQGISITGVKNLYVKNCKFNDTAGTMPQCGLDLEPNFKDGVGLQNILFEDCEFSGNLMTGIYFSNNSHLPISATFRNCLVKNNRHGGIVLGYTGRGDTKEAGKIEFISCRVEGHKTSGISMQEHTLRNVKVVFRDCVIDNRKSATNALVLSSDSEKDVYGVEIRNLTVLDDQKRDPVVFLSRYGNALIDPVVENVFVKDSKGNTTRFDCASFIKKSAPDPVLKAFKVNRPEPRTLFPVTTKGVTVANTVRFRERTEYLVYAKKGTKTPIRFTYKAVHKFNKKPVTITMYSPLIPPRTEKILLPYEETLTYVLEARETGIHRFVIDAKNQTVIATSNVPGQAFASDKKLYILACSGYLYFAVPAGVKEIQLEASGVAREESDAAIVDPSGNVVKEEKRIRDTKLMIVKRKNPDKYEVWGVKFNASKLFLRLGAPIPQIFSVHPSFLLVNKGEEGKYNLTTILPKRLIVRNGDFRALVKPRRDYVIASELFPESWGGRDAALLTTEDHRNHIEFTGMLWSYLNPPAGGGRMKCTLTASGSGTLHAFFSTSMGKAPHKRRAPEYGPFTLTDKPQEFSFDTEFKPGERGYIYIRAGAKSKVRLSDVRMELTEE